jgi:pimeloyl-ACP methyl ester carboxylesterase
MTTSTTTTDDGIDIVYKDWGSKTAQPIVFHHGWPLSSDDWDAQMSPPSRSDRWSRRDGRRGMRFEPKERLFALTS